MLRLISDARFRAVREDTYSQHERFFGGQIIAMTTALLVPDSPGETDTGLGVKMVSPCDIGLPPDVLAFLLSLRSAVRVRRALPKIPLAFPSTIDYNTTDVSR